MKRSNTERDATIRRLNQYIPKKALVGGGRSGRFDGLFLHRAVEKNPFRFGSLSYNSFEDIPFRGGLEYAVWRKLAGPEFFLPRRAHLVKMVRKSWVFVRKNKRPISDPFGSKGSGGEE